MAADKDSEPKKIDVTGTLKTGIVAIGGETTGIIIETKDTKYELEFGKDKELKAKAQKLNGKKGLIFAATPASDFICGTLQLAAGMNLHVFTTGRGTPYGLAAAPVIKVATRSELARRWKDLIDFDSGSIATGEKTIEECGWDLFRLILDVASGRTKPWSDRWGIHNDLTLFNPAPVT